ncbi:MAG: hypothetical protein HDS45_00705 [Bacteroides sp.]|nr:hypothetical protein [Bacteroides sp.]MDE7462645.1 hypothetical protein [Muribaculaceae bacterium]
MPNDSTIYLREDYVAPSVRKPRQTTIAFIRQFSRSYVAMAGVTLNTLVCN